MLNNTNLHLHLGAHKTATTYLQSKLELNRGKLSAAGVDYQIHMRLRPLLRIYHDSLEVSGRASAIAALIDALREVFRDDRRLVYCEELLLGSVQRCLKAGALYPREGMLMSNLISQLPVASISVAVRSYETFLPSFYVLALRTGWTRRFKYFKRLFDLEGRGWAEVIADVAALARGVPVTVWRYEDFPELEEQCMAEMLGSRLHLISPTPRNVTPRASTVRLAWLGGLIGGPSWVRKGLRLGPRLFGTRGAAFMPMDAIERELLQNRYRVDCKKIAAIPGVTMVMPDAGLSAFSACA